MTTWQATWKPPRPVHHNPAVVLDLEKDVDEDGIKQAFSKYGKVENIHRPKNETFAFIYYHDKYDAEKATLSLDGQQLGGRQVRVRDGKKVFKEVSDWRSKLLQGQS